MVYRGIILYIGTREPHFFSFSYNNIILCIRLLVRLDSDGGGIVSDVCVCVYKQILLYYYNIIVKTLYYTTVTENNST